MDDEREPSIVDAADSHPARWWEASALATVNGVFKGGGAKGVAYAGALAALRDDGVWFASVAGASAGAITAALIAAGVTPEELEKLTPDALTSVQSNKLMQLGRIALGWSTAIFDNRRLRDFLDERLRAQMALFGRAVAGEGVTFAELFDATGIDLFVVTMDLATATPMVFNRLVAPDVEVAAAVAASCAIPMAFPPGRAIVRSDLGDHRVHQLVDGGAWANYPSFIYRDASFQAWLGAAEPEAPSRPVVGFVLGAVPEDSPRGTVGFVGARPRISRRFDLGPTVTSPHLGQFAVGSVLGSDWSRLFVGAAMVAWVLLSLSLWPLSLRWLTQQLAGLPGFLYPLVLFATTTLLTLAAAAVFASLLSLLTLGRMLADTALPSAQAALGVATGVAPWVGTHPDDVAIEVPYGNIATTQFVLDPDLRERVVRIARERTSEQLANATGLRRSLGLAPRQTTARSAEPDLPQAEPPRKATRVREDVLGVLNALVLAIVIVGGGLISVNTLDGNPTFWRTILAVSLPVIGVTIALLLVVRRMAAAAHERAMLGVTVADRRLRPVTRGMVILAVVGVLATVVGLAGSGWSLAKVDANLARGTVQGALVRGSLNEYLLDGAPRRGGAPAQYRLFTTSNLQLKESVLIRRDGDHWALSQPLGQRMQILWLAFAMFGVGALTSTIKRRQWRVRRSRLAAALR